ncbi:GlyGly-anchored extracellular serine protease VesC [Vibrio cholerae]|nr:GlyGly-anchored extracellular serine protease VesC [Vibrio cholerae]EGR1018906.1 GlyGly-CTERM sorting domain-containing protein [Vibrio cholerae]EGR4466570.1 GlyGly-anchored extracellular serine protease VesC [Vibrio cholerae]ELJ8489085.1 GlyGly-anchored extracellular serine protease VesC [Vibrio cholerae]
MNKTFLSGVVGTLLFTSFQFSASGTESGVSSRIIGGEQATAGEWPYMVALTARNSSHVFCGGSYLGGRYVLTAAHCVDKEDSAKGDVLLGAFDMNDVNTAERIHVRQIYVHNSYIDASMGNDIAVLELERDPLPRRSVQISDSSDFNELTKDSPMTVIGFGKRKEVDGEKSDPATILHQVQVPFVPLPECKTKGSDEDAKDDYSKLTNNAFCAGSFGKDSCFGDSGGPIFFDSNNGRKQMGVVSWGDGCGRANSPGVYTNLSVFNDWLDDQQLGLSYRQKRDLGVVRPGSYTHNLTFTNNGNADINLGNTFVFVVGISRTDAAAIVNNSCTGVLASGASCDVEFSYNITEHKQSYVKLIIGSSTYRTGAVHAYLYFDALDAAPSETVSFLANLPVHNTHVNDHPWTVVGNGLQTSALPAGEESVILLENLPQGRLKFHYKLSSSEVLDQLFVYVNDKFKGKYFNNTENLATLDMYGTSNKVRFVYRRHSGSTDDQSRAILSQISYDPKFFDLPPPLDIRIGDSGGGSLGGAALALLFGCGWLRRRQRV